MTKLRAYPLSTGAAFLALIALIFSLALNGLWQLHTLGEQIRTMVEVHNFKIDLVTQTQAASRLRTDSLFRMALATDPFERDTHFMAFNRAGFLVARGRQALRAAGLDGEEQRRFEAQNRLIVEIQAAQGLIVDRLNAEHHAEARRMLIGRAIPLQDAFNRSLGEMRERYRTANLDAQRIARKTYRQTMLLTLALGIGAILLALLIAWRTLRKARVKSQQIREQLAELQHSRAALHEEATHDALTGLANRRLFYDRLRQAIQRARRYGSRLGLLYIDLDRFKTINDLHGHHVGDAVLLEVAQQIRACVRGSDTAARLGGDEFIVLFEGLQDRHDCVAAARKIEQALSRNPVFDELGVEVEASIGQALYPDDGADEDALIRHADAAMYRVKSGVESQRQTPLPF